MRRNGGVVLVAVGVFLIVMAPLLRFFVYPRLAVVPQDQDTISTLVGEDATVFDTATLSPITTTLTTQARTLGDDAAVVDAPDGTVVWQLVSSTKDSEGKVRSRSVQRVAFDNRSAEAVDCCGTFSSTSEGEQTPVTYSGLIVKFPFETEKKDYEWWDGDLGAAAPIKYERTEDVDGLRTYKFVQTIAPTPTGAIDLPADILGLPGDDTLTAEQTYSNVRTLWVEPRTGVVIAREEKQHNTLRYDGEDRVVITDVTTRFDEETVADNVDEYGALSTRLYVLKVVAPLAGLVAGLLALVAGVLLQLRAPKHHAM